MYTLNSLMLLSSFRNGILACLPMQLFASRRNIVDLKFALASILIQMSHMDVQFTAMSPNAKDWIPGSLTASFHF